METMTPTQSQPVETPPRSSHAPVGGEGASAGGETAAGLASRRGAGWSEASQRVDTYFASLGLRDKSRREAVVRDVLNRINPTGSDSIIVRRAVDEAVESVEAWIDDIVTRTAAQTPMLSRAAAPRRVLAWKLRPLLEAHPEAFLSPTELPAAMEQALREAMTPVLPEALPMPMPTQQLQYCSLLPDTHWPARIRRGLREKFDALLAAMDGN